MVLALVLAGMGPLCAAPAAVVARRSTTEVSLVTILPGKSLYASFGHSAIRIVEPLTGYDVLYNFGLSARPFDLGFALGMLVGKMDFMVGVLDTDSTLAYYRDVENRTIIEQRLDLDEARKARLVSGLETNARPENREYNYRYFTDNCATRVWEILAAAGEGDTDTGALPARPTLRGSVDRALSPRPWLGFAIGLLLGPATDAPVAAKAPIFLPEELMEWTAGLSRVGEDGRVPLVEETKVLYKAVPTAPSPLFPGPLAVSLSLLVVAMALGLLLHRDHPLALCLDAVFSAAVAIAGLAIALFWIAAGYGEVSMDLNLLWAGPLPLLALIFSRKGRDVRFSIVLFRIAAVAAGSVAMLGGLGLQSISPATRIMAFTVLVRCLVRSFRREDSPFPTSPGIR